MKKYIHFLLLFLMLLTGCRLGQSGTGSSPTQATTDIPDQLAAFEAAADYSEKTGGVSMLVWNNGKIIYERYPLGSSAGDSHALHSGTKSFSCAIAVSAASDGVLAFDERVADTITEWADDPQKSQITIRQLISLSSGLSGGKVGDTPTYTEALNFKMVGVPGETFDYGPVPFQVFGELMKRKLGSSPLGYLTQKVFEPIGLTYESWTHTSDGDPHLPNGAHLTAQEWLKFGILIINMGKWDDKHVLDESLLRECFQGSSANLGYGMSFWLPGEEGGNISAEDLDNGTTTDAPKNRVFPADLLQASGAQGQRLFIIPSQGVIIVRQAEPGLFQNTENFSDVKFFRLLQGTTK